MDKPLNWLQCDNRLGWQANGVTKYLWRCLAAARLARMVHSLLLAWLRLHHGRAQMRLGNLLTAEFRLGVNPLQPVAMTDFSTSLRFRNGL